MLLDFNNLIFMKFNQYVLGLLGIAGIHVLQGQLHSYTTQLMYIKDDLLLPSFFN